MIPTLLPQSSVSSILRQMFRQQLSAITLSKSIQRSYREEYCKWHQLFHDTDNFNSLLESERMLPESRPLLYREFVEALVRVSFVLTNHQSPAPPLSVAMNMFMTSFTYQPVKIPDVVGNTSDAEGLRKSIAFRDDLCRAWILQLSSVLDPILSRFESVKVRSLVRIMGALYKQVDAHEVEYKPKTIRTSLDAYNVSGGSITDTHIPISALLHLCNAELVLAEVHEVFVLANLLRRDEMPSNEFIGKELTSALHHNLATEKNLVSNPSFGKSSRCLDRLGSSLCRRGT